MNDRKPKLPNFKSDYAERKFWSQHSLEEFSDELEDLDTQIRPARTEQIALRLYKNDLESLKKLAKRRGVGHTTLARSIVEQWLVAIISGNNSRLPHPVGFAIGPYDGR